MKVDLAKQIKRLESIILVTPGHVYWKDLDGVFLGCNHLQAVNAGLSDAGDIVGKTDYDMPWKDQADNIREMDKHAISSDQEITVEERSYLADGRKATFLSKKIPWKDEDGNIIGIVGISFDITAKKEAEELRREKAAAERRARYLRAAAGSIAHELRTPLASIKMAAEFISRFWHILLSGYKQAHAAQLNVEEIKPRPMHQLEGRIDSVLQQTRYANAFIDLVLGNLKEEDDLDIESYHRCDIVDVVNQCLFRYPFNDDEQSLIIWDPDQQFHFKGDEFLAINVLNNLIKNALYYIRDANKGNIHIWLEQGREFNRLYFKDTAKGASEEIVGHVFESFYTKRNGGTGLGLAFCKKIMNSFSGNITASSVEGEYMQFILSFPRTHDDDE